MIAFSTDIILQFSSTACFGELMFILYIFILCLKSHYFFKLRVVTKFESICTWDLMNFITTSFCLVIENDNNNY